MKEEEFEIPEDDGSIPQWMIDRDKQEEIDISMDKNDYSLGMLPEEDEGAIQVAKENLKADTTKAKKEAIESLVIENNSIAYAGDDLSQLRMSCTIALANHAFNKNIGLELTKLAQSPLIPDEAKPLVGGIAQVLTGTYNAVYKDNKVPWKGADSKIHIVEVESIAEALLKAMRSVGGLVTEEER